MVKQGFNVEKIVVFGSYIKGERREDNL